ncbi:MAG: tripartite tricarboxylate transporter TctB family protein [Syntrophobacter sp.]
MPKAERLFQLILLLLCMVYLYASLNTALGTIDEPGSGFVPSLLGGAGMAVALFNLINSLRKTTEGKEEGWSRDGMLRMGACVVITILFIAIFEVLGAIVSIFAAVFLMTKLLGAKGWLRPLLLATASALLSYFVFFSILEVPLPRGIF